MHFYLLVQRFSHLSLASEGRPPGLGFKQCSFTPTRLALATHEIDDFALRCFCPQHATLPSPFRDSSLFGKDKLGTHEIFQQSQYHAVHSFSAADAAHFGCSHLAYLPCAEYRATPAWLGPVDDFLALLGGA